jgi:pilus assembly protein FimV
VHLNIGEKFVKLFFKTLMSVSLLSLACSASAVTLGAIKVKSTQGQPLRAEIEILSLTQEEARDFHVKLATQNEHLRLGFDWRALMATITIEILVFLLVVVHFFVLRVRRPLMLKNLVWH